MAKVRWLDRTLVLGPHLCLCMSEAEYKKAKKHIGWVDDDPWCTPSSGRVHMEFGENPAAIVCLSYESDDAVAVAGILAHEATHIWQEWLRSMGEHAPGDEISAYAVQNMVVVLMSEWARRMQEMVDR